MAGPTTEHLSQQLDKVRDSVATMGREVEGARREAVDGLRGLGDTLAAQIDKLHLHFDEALGGLRGDVAEGREAMMAEHSLVRQDVARLQVQTGGLAERLDRANSQVHGLKLTLIGVGVTICLAIGGAAWNASWNASRIVAAVEDHGRRIEKIEEGEVEEARFQRSLDEIKRSLDEITPASPTIPQAMPPSR